MNALKLSLLALTVVVGLEVHAQEVCLDLYKKAQAAESLNELGAKIFGPEVETKVYEEPFPMSTRFDLVAESYPILDAQGKPRRDLPVYHVRPNAQYKKWFYEQAKRSDVKIIEFAQRTEEHGPAKRLLRYLGFNTVDKADPLLGYYYETIPSPMYFEARRAQWNAEHTPRKQVHVSAINDGADGQKRMAVIWEKDFGISIADSFNGPESAKFLQKINERKAKQSTEDYKPELVEDLTAKGERRLLAEDQQLFFHDLWQWTNSLWMDRGSLEATRKITRFYLEIDAVVRKPENRDLQVPMPANIRPAYEIGKPTPSGKYTALRLHLDALHDSQRALHSLTHIGSWLINNPKGLRPGVDFITTRGAQPLHETLTHLQGLGVKPPNREGPSKEPNQRRTWALAKETTGHLKLEDGLAYVTNADLKRAETVARVLGEQIPEIREIYERHVQAGTFIEYEKSTIDAWAKEIRWRYHNMADGRP